MKRKTGIYKKMLIVAVVPVLIFGIVITLFSYNRFKKTVYNEAKENLENIASGIEISYDISYPGDYALIQGKNDKYDFYKGASNITYDCSIIDSHAVSTGTEISVLYMDMRVHTTFKTTAGKRLAGLCTNAETANEVLYDGNEVFYESIDILDKDYLVLYVPLKNSDASIIGMIEIAKESSSLKKSVLKAVWPVLVLAIPGMALAAYFSFKNTKNITEVLKAIQIFLNKVATGNLSAELDAKYLRREDELGEISRSSVQMQKGIRASVETDPLTGLNNRRYLINSMKHLTDRAKETGVPYSVAITDIDHFKAVNDTYGHKSGDDVLIAVANQLKQAMQGKGFASRWGGEEFVLVFDKTDMKSSIPTLEALADSIRGMTVLSEGYEIKITMTMGITEGFTDDINRLVEAADEKLYYGKTHGRNQIVSEIQNPQKPEIK